MRTDEEDRAHMAEALALAERGRGFVSPNPLVGAVVVRGRRVIGRGWHERYGAAHAEIVALSDAGEDARGAAMYVTLEPCCVWGNTPPCTEAIIESGIREVVFALEDPNPDVCGRGLSALRGAGILVRKGVLAEEAAAVNAGYLRYRTCGLPSVVVKLALSLDGRAAPPAGGPRWTSSESSRALVHEMRAAADCVMVGVGTVLADDPQLTDRREGTDSRQPSRLVLDSSLRIPAGSRLVSTAGDVGTVVACANDASEDREEALRRRGVEVWRFDRTPDGLDLDAVLRRVAAEGGMYLLAEGGPRVASSLLREGLADRVAFFVCPVLYGPGCVAGLAEAPPELSRRGGFRSACWRQVGGDSLFEAEIVRPRKDVPDRERDVAGARRHDVHRSD